MLVMDFRISFSDIDQSQLYQEKLLNKIVRQMHIGIQRTLKEDSAFHDLISIPIFLNSLGLMFSTSRSAAETARKRGKHIKTTSTGIGTSFL